MSEAEAVTEPETSEQEAVIEPEVASEAEAVTEDVPEANEETSEPDQEEMMNLDLGSPRQIKQGDVISGIVVQVREDEALIDIGGKSEGVIRAGSYL